MQVIMDKEYDVTIFIYIYFVNTLDIIFYQHCFQNQTLDILNLIPDSVSLQINKQYLLAFQIHKLQNCARQFQQVWSMCCCYPFSFSDYVYLFQKHWNTSANLQHLLMPVVTNSYNKSESAGNSNTSNKKTRQTTINRCHLKNKTDTIKNKLCKFISNQNIVYQQYMFISNQRKWVLT